jgi:hypothetical protein
VINSLLRTISTSRRRALSKRGMSPLSTGMDPPATPRRELVKGNEANETLPVAV